MVNALKAVNRPVELFTLEGADHGFINRLNSTEGQQVFESALAYLQQNSR
jgi:dipeptidyl aminopeptidase/acylaminoacyl peptidase